MKKYLVKTTIVLSRTVEANSGKEAERIARDMGEYDADISRSVDWKAKLIKAETTA